MNLYHVKLVVAFRDYLEILQYRLNVNYGPISSTTSLEAKSINIP